MLLSGQYISIFKMKAEWKRDMGHLGLWRNIRLKDFTTIKIGGPAKLFVPSGLPELQEAVRLLDQRGAAYRLLGNGSNLLVAGEGVKEVVIKLQGDDFEYIKEGKEGQIEAGSGLSLQKVLSFCQECSWGGLEFLAGIPATLGGAVRNNAGALGEEIMRFVSSLAIMDKKGRIIKLEGKNLAYSYRRLHIKETDIIISVVLKLKKTNKRLIQKRMDFNRAYRRRTQETRFASAGCVFANPSASLPAGLLIEAAGLKGFRKNAAAVSSRHANFIINLGGASFKDVMYLIKYIEKNVKNSFGISLKREVEIWPEAKAE